MFKRKRYPFSATMRLNGRHPYLKDNSLDYPTREVVVIVQARNWNDAERQALNNTPRDRPYWSASVKSIMRGDAFAMAAEGQAVTNGNRTEGE
jgi:hypothetical protein